MQKNSFTYMVYCLRLMILTLVTISYSFGQNVDEDLKRISLKFESDQILLDQQINYYESYSSKKPTESNSTILKRNNDLVYINAFGTETLINNGLSVLVDHQSKTILLDKNDGSEFKDGLAIDFNAIKEKSSEIKYKEISEMACYTFFFKEGEEFKAEIWFNKEKFETKKIVIYMRNKIRLEMLITELKTAVDFDSTIFSLERFITTSNEGIIPKEKFKKYKLINNIRN